MFEHIVNICQSASYYTVIHNIYFLPSSVLLCYQLFPFRRNHTPSLPLYLPGCLSLQCFILEYIFQSEFPLKMINLYGSRCCSIDIQQNVYKTPIIIVFCSMFLKIFKHNCFAEIYVDIFCENV